MTQIQLSFNLIQSLHWKGVRDFVLCAGGRNSPLVEVLTEIIQHKDNKADLIRVHHFFNENSGAFFALGRIKSEGRPVAVITTSGTAVAETLPAVIEAHYTCLPLIVVSADRPASYRGSGAPQAIEQVGLFSDYVQGCVEVSLQSSNGSVIKNLDLGYRPWHINVELDEPLIDGSVKDLDMDGLCSHLDSDLLNGEFPFGFSSSETKDEEGNSKVLKEFLTENKKPLILIGELSSLERQWVHGFLQNFSYPVFAEVLSGLSFQDLPSSLVLSSDLLVRKKLMDGEFDSILRLGGVPVLRAWRDLENKLSHLPVLSISRRPFSGLSEKRSLLPMGCWLESFIEEQQLSQEFLGFEALRDENNLLLEKTCSLIDQFPQSEMALLYNLSKQIPCSERIYLGNSMPIRQWDLLSHLNKEGGFSEVSANRGANGIDGQVSTFLGWSKKERIQWGILGDLTALYDQSGLWASRYAQGKWRLVVINNSGGRIFSRIFSNKSFLNEHELDFSSWAKMWGCSYFHWQDIPQDLSELPDRVIIEIQPDLKQSENFWHSYQKLF